MESVKWWEVVLGMIRLLPGYLIRVRTTRAVQVLHHRLGR